MNFDRPTLIEAISDRLADGSDLNTLISFYVDSQVDWRESFTDSELKDYSTEEEFLEDYYDH